MSVRWLFVHNGCSVVVVGVHVWVVYVVSSLLLVSLLGYYDGLLQLVVLWQWLVAWCGLQCCGCAVNGLVVLVVV